MKLIRKIKRSAGGRKLKKEAEPQRVRAGSNFNIARRVGLVYKDQDENLFNKIRAYAKYLKDTFGIKSVMAIGFVDEVYKRLPVWQSQKLEFSFFTREDLSWHMKPVKNVKPFIQEDFDILIDLSNGLDVPVNFIMKESRAGMKVCRKGSGVESYCDFIIDMGSSEPIDKYIEQLNKYLSNPKIQ